MTLLAIASEAFELAPWLRRCSHVTRLDWPVPHAHKASANGTTLFAVASGPGPRLSSQALQTALLHAPPFDKLISIGLCGALHPGLELKQICSATHVSDGGHSYPAQPLPGTRPVRLLSVDKFLGSPPEKRTLHQQGHDIVEMEAAPLALYAAQNNIPFHAVKVVSDLAHENFPLDFNQFRDPAGRFQKGRIALAACKNPLRLVPDLFRMASRGPAASEILGVFLANVRL
jgi:nucleoside phosphorylase